MRIFFLLKVITNYESEGNWKGKVKAVMVLPTLLLQKTSLTSKSKDNVEILKRRLNQWKDRQKEKLLVEGKTIQEDYLKTT